MVYNPKLKGPSKNKREIARAEQNRKYTNLADFMYKLTTVNGRHQYERPGLFRLLKSSRILTRDGHVRVERLQRLARSLGVHDPHHPQSGNLPSVFYDEDDVWDYIADGGS